MKKTLYISAVVGLVMAFQNCGKSIVGSDQSVNSEQVGTNQQDSSTISQPVEFDLKSVDKIKFFNQLDASYLTVDLQDGSIRLYNRQGQEQTSSHESLESEDLSKIKALIGSVKICSDDRKQDPNMMCAMLYRAPYVFLLAKNQELSLGEAFDSCHSGPDICDPKQKTQLVDFIKELSQEYFKNNSN